MTDMAGLVSSTASDNNQEGYDLGDFYASPLDGKGIRLTTDRYVFFLYSIFAARARIDATIRRVCGHSASILRVPFRRG